MNTIIKYLLLIDDVLTDFIGDLKSFRVQLVYFALGINIWILKEVVKGQLDWKIFTVSIGMLTIVYGYYFQSKQKQAEMENQKLPEDEDPKIERDPDKE